MLQIELFSLLISLFVLPLLCWSLETRPKPVASAIFPFLVESILCLRNVHCCRYGSRFGHHVVERHRNGACGLVLVSFLLTFL